MTTHTLPKTGQRNSRRRVWRSGLRTSTDLRHVKGDFIVVGDVHGCWNTLNTLIEAVGGKDGTPPPGTTIVSVGDLHDKGGRIGVDADDVTVSGSVNVLRWALRLQQEHRLITVDSNHGRHLAQRIAAGTTSRSTRSCGDVTYRDLLAQPDASELIPKVSRYLHSLPPFVRLTGGPTGELVVAHAAAVERLLHVDTLTRAEYDFFLYTEDDFRWTGPQTVVTGHVQVPEPVRLRQPQRAGATVGDVIRIDTEVNKGGGLSAYLSSEDRFITVPTSSDDLRR